MPDLRGRLAIVTGAAGDIGGAISRRLAAAGADLVLSDLPGAADAVERVAASCRELAPSARADVVLFDVADAEAVETAIADLEPAPDLLANNAGYQGDFAALPHVPIDDATRVMSVNVVGVLTVLQAFARRAAPDRPGAVVNTASMAGVDGAPNMAAYSASKAAVIGLTKSAAKDLAPLGLRVNAVSPAFIGPGAMWDNQVARQAAIPSQYYADTPAAVAAEMIDQIPLRRYGGVDEVADAVVYLLSDEASYVTGVNLEVSGGV